MPLVPLYGHETLSSRLLTALSRGTLPQSLLLHGPAGVGKQRLALWLGQALLCEGENPPCGVCRQCRYTGELTHPDLIWVFPRARLKDADVTAHDVRLDLADGAAERLKAGGLYAPPPGSDGLHVATMRMLVHGASTTPALARRKVYIVGEADRMSILEGAEYAANAFLKLLEEPPADTNLILTSSSPGALLPTIRSRVVAVRVPPLPDRVVGAWLADPVVAEALASADLPRSLDERIRLAAGAPGRLLASTSISSASAAARRLLDVAESGDGARSFRAALAQGVSGARGTFSDILDALTVALHDRVKTALDSDDERKARNASRAMELVEASKLMADGNVNPQLITSALLRDLTRALAAR